MTEAKWKFTRILGLTCCVGVLAAGIATRADAEKPKAQKKVSFQTASPTAENIQASVETSLDTAKGATRYISSGHNACEGRIPIFNGLTPFNTTMATTDGPPEPACTGGAGPTNDIWYNYTADFTGDINVTTCEEEGGSATFDTVLVVYDGCDCGPPSPLLGCNDDDPDNACGTGAGGFHSASVILLV